MTRSSDNPHQISGHYLKKRGKDTYPTLQAEVSLCPLLMTYFSLFGKGSLAQLVVASVSS